MADTAKRRRIVWAATAVLAAAAVAVSGRILVSYAFSNAGMVALVTRMQGTPAASVLTAGDAPRAEPLLETAVRWYGGNLPAQRGLGWLAFARGESAEAGMRWQQGGLTALDFLEAGRQSWGEGDPDAALVWFEAARAVAPEMGDAYFYAAQLKKAQGQWEGALALYDETASKTVFDNPALLAEAKEQHDALAQARWEHLMGEGMQAVQDSEYETAMDLYREAFAVLPDLGDPHYYIAVSYEAMGDGDSALSALQAALTASDFRDAKLATQAHLLRAEILRGLGRSSDAIPDYEYVAAHDSTAFWPRAWLGIAYWETRKDADRAESFLRQAVALNSGVKLPYRWLGVIYESTHRPELAIEAFEALLAIDPEDTGVAAHLAALREKVP